MHPIGSLVVVGVAGALFVWTFTAAQNRWRIDDVLGGDLSRHRITATPEREINW
jgi:ammonia channel protein AmtB